MGKADQQPLVQVDGLTKSYASPGLLSQGPRIRALDGVSFHINQGEVVALVGESGSGKSTIARQLIRLETPDSGVVMLGGALAPSKEGSDVALSYRRRVQMIFQDPFGSFNPVHTIGHHLVRPLLRHEIVMNDSDARMRGLALLEEVGLSPGSDFIDRFPYELSGGQRQRVAIARALAVEPEVIIADEPTSMLDVSIRVDVLNLLQDLRKQRGVSLLFITHDLVSARYLADRILVMYCGRIVEEGPAERVLKSPKHPYTQLLLSATPEVANLLEESPNNATRGGGKRGDWKGCAFRMRCDWADDRCLEVPKWTEIEDEGGRALCHAGLMEAANRGENE